MLSEDKKSDACWEAARRGQVRLGRADSGDGSACSLCRDGSHSGICLRKGGKGIPGDCLRSDYGKQRWVAATDLRAGEIMLRARKIGRSLLGR